MICFHKTKQVIAEMLNKIEHPLQTTYSLFIHNDFICLHPGRLNPKSKGFIVYLSPDHIKNGLSSIEWGAIMILTAAAMIKENIE